MLNNPFQEENGNGEASGLTPSFKMTITERTPSGVRNFDNNAKNHQAGVDKVATRMKMFAVGADPGEEFLDSPEQLYDEDWQVKSERLVLLAGGPDEAIDFFDRLVKVMPKLAFDLIRGL